MTRPMLLAALLATFALQWAVPGWLIAQGQMTLNQGQRYYFRTAPVDPADPFRGRYVTLSFDAARLALPAALQLRTGERVYLPLRVGADRYAQFDTPLRAAPQDRAYLEARVRWVSGGELTLDLPFDRYYLDEALAPAAERAYREASRNGGGAAAKAYVSVKIWRGHAVLEELFIDDVPVRQRLQQAR